MRPRLLPKQLRAFLARLRKTDRPAITSASVSIRVTEEPQIPVVSEATVEDASHEPTWSPLVISPDSSNTVAISSTLVKKYESGAGENKVSVRIFKEPHTKPIIVEPSRDAEVKPADDTLILRWNKDGPETPIEPSYFKM